jgi:hypothetical protein
MKLFKFFFYLSFISFSFILVSCSKNKPYSVVVPPPEVHFSIPSSIGAYYVTNDANSTFKIPIGITRAPDKDITIQFTVTSPTGAVQGQQYSLTSNSITIHTGTVLDSISLKGIFAGYSSGRRDTLVFKITGGDVPALIGSDIYTVVLQKYCNVVLSDLSGVFNRSFDFQSPDNLGPYPTKITATSTGPTSAKLMIQNFGNAMFANFVPSDPAYSPGIEVDIDFSNPSNFTTTVPTQAFYTDPTYGAATIKANGKGTFSSCDQSFTINYTVTVAAGSFGNFITTIKR